MGDYDDYLKSLDEQHNPEGVPEQGFEKLPDGTYQTRLDKIYIAKSKAEKMQCVWEFEVMTGLMAFRKVFKFSGMDTAQKLDFLTNDLRRAGIENFKWSNVQEQFPKVLDKLFLIELKSKAKDGTIFQSVYIQKLLNQNDVLIGKALMGDVPF